MAQLLIFDWDGTLCDSLSRIVEAIRSSAVALELPVPTENASRDVIGLGDLAERVRRAGRLLVEVEDLKRRRNEASRAIGEVKKAILYGRLT